MTSMKKLQQVQALPEYQQGQERYNELLVRSATDMVFRRRLIDRPMEALAEFYGHEVPDEVRSLDLHFVENEGDVTIVLPDQVMPEHELKAEDLEAVAGGGIVFTVVLLSTAACASAVISAGAVIGIYKIASE